MTQDLLGDAMQQLLAQHSAPAYVREIEHGADADTLWTALEYSGFLDALVSEAQGGAGLLLPEVFSIVFIAGRHVAPVPLAQTLLLRGALGAEAPRGPLTIAPVCHIGADGAIDCTQVPFGRMAQWVLVETKDQTRLLPTATVRVSAAGGYGSLDADLHWEHRPDASISLPFPSDWRAQAANLTAALMAGAMERVFEMTTAYANERKQFGKAIGKQQAIQQQLSVLAEQVFAARMAARIGFKSTSTMAESQRAAIAKERASSVAPEVCAIAHAVHGAMGFTEEYDLQLFTRRLHEWRMAYGAESEWRLRLGAAALRSEHSRSLDIVREQLMAC